MGASKLGIIIYEILLEAILSAIPAIGFAMLFNVPVKFLKHCAILAAFGHVLRTSLSMTNLSLEWSTFLVAILIGMIGIYWSPRLLVHPKVFTVAAIIPMFPGIPAYKAMIALVTISDSGYSDHLMQVMMTNLIKAVFIVGALAIGLALPGLWSYRSRRRV